MTTPISPVDSTAAWARLENERTAIERLIEGVKDTKTNKAVDSANSKMTIAGKVQYPR